jgi:hypothetical protein
MVIGYRRIRAYSLTTLTGVKSYALTNAWPLGSLGEGLPRLGSAAHGRVASAQLARFPHAN